MRPCPLRIEGNKMQKSLFLVIALSSFLFSNNLGAETLNGPVRIQGWDIYYTQGKSWLNIVDKFTGANPLDPGAVGVNTNTVNGYLTGLPEGAKFYFPWALDQNLASVFAQEWYNKGLYPNNAVRLPNDQPPFSTINHTPFFVWSTDVIGNPVYWEAYTQQADSAAGSTDISTTDFKFALALEPVSN